MNLSPQKCLTILASHYAATDAKEKKQQKKLDHAQRVFTLCQALIPQLPDSLRTDLLLTAAIFHDIAKFDHGPHHLQAAVVLKTVPGLTPEEQTALGQIIAAHKGPFAPAPEFAAEAAVLRMADCLDRVRRKTAALRRKQAKPRTPKNLEKLAEKQAELAEANTKYQDGLDAVRAYAASASPGGCTAAFVQALEAACQSLREVSADPNPSN